MVSKVTLGPQKKDHALKAFHVVCFSQTMVPFEKHKKGFW
jgi:hypothetical protein